MPRAQRAPDRDNQRLLGVQAQLLFSGALCVAGKLSAHRRAGHSDPFRIRIVLPALFKAHQDPIHMLSQEPRGEARRGVTLVDEGRDVQAGGSHQHRITDIAARADHRIRLEVLDDFLRFTLRGDHVLERAQIVADGGEGASAADVGDFQRPYLITLAGHELHLHLTLGAEEQKLAVRHQLPQPSGHRKGGIDMSGRTAAGQDEFHFSFTFLPKCHGTRSARFPSPPAESAAPCRRS